jgi:hypothetical protein
MTLPLSKCCGAPRVGARPKDDPLISLLCSGCGKEFVEQEENCKHKNTVGGTDGFPMFGAKQCIDCHKFLDLQPERTDKGEGWEEVFSEEWRNVFQNIDNSLDVTVWKKEVLSKWQKKFKQNIKSFITQTLSAQKEYYEKELKIADDRWKASEVENRTAEDLCTEDGIRQDERRKIVGEIEKCYYEDMNGMEALDQFKFDKFRLALIQKL